MVHDVQQQYLMRQSRVVHDVQQQYLMRQARHNMEGDTVCIVFDFK